MNYLKLEYSVMMETDKLRKADIFSGASITLLGSWIIYQALQMPMKDSYGGVQNVWYVSPALFPLFVGSILALLGLLLIRTALKQVGSQGINQVLSYLRSSDFALFLRSDISIRYYSIVFNLLMFVFVLIPRVDFFLSAILFLLSFFFMFYCGSSQYLLQLFRFVIAGSIFLIIYIFSTMPDKLHSLLPNSADWLVLALIAALVFTARRKLEDDPALKRKFKRSLIIAFAAPLTIGIIFKYFLLVPMPFEGIVVWLLDLIWYAEIWS